jgi:hypothetical protein
MTAKPVKLAVRDVAKSFRIRGKCPSEDRILNVLGGVSFQVRQSVKVDVERQRCSG